jgi:hypothetical protein
MKASAGQEGFVLITAIMLLFVTTVLGLMVMQSSNMEIMLSGAQQRYEDSLNVSEGGGGVEASAVGTGITISRNGGSRSYAVVNPTVRDQVVSPKVSSSALFDPGGDMALSGPITVTTGTPPEQWPMDNLLQSDDHANDRYDYHYRVVYLHDDAPPQGFGADRFSGYLFEIGAQQNILVEMGGSKVGPKMSL